VKTVLKGTRSQHIEVIRKNIVTELIAVPLDTYSDCFVHILEMYKRYIAVTIDYLEEKLIFNLCVCVCVCVCVCYVLE
jgi:hypothetical protein